MKRFLLPDERKYKDIGDYGIIGNMRTAALVAFDGSIDWCCFPRFDSDSIFASILDSEKGGYWRITPEQVAYSEQSYLENTNILRTRFIRKDSLVEIIDFMPYLEDDYYNHIDRGALAAIPEIHRILICKKGSMSLKMNLRPRFFYGRLSGKIKKWREGYSFSALTEELVFSTSLRMCSIARDMISCRLKVKKDEIHYFILSYGESRPRRFDEYETEKKLEKTKNFWLSYASSLKYNGLWKKEVIRSALVLKMLTYSPTGAIIAAPTTSLPEAIGGNRNWDYRYSWIRDSAFSLWAFHELGSRSEAERYLHWLIIHNPALDRDLKLMYTIDGRATIEEKELLHLEGYRGSRPVRVGNDAIKQVQLDAHGCILDALYFSAHHGYGVSPEIYYRFVRPLAYYICENWRKKGNGIWEFRNLTENFVYTKAWCYVGLDRACKIAEATGHDSDTKVWRNVMKKTKNDIISKGWNQKIQAFSMFYGSDYLDASLLLLPMIGFIDANDIRMKKTAEAIMNRLTKNGLLKRYDAPDGLKGEEGSFMICNFWLVSYLAKAKKVNQARKLFEELISLSNHLGLYSEEIDFSTKKMLGNFPQAFSHMGLVMAAQELSKALKKG